MRENLPGVYSLNDLFKSTTNFRKNSYSPYSNFSVASGIIAADDNSSFIVYGTNVENASYGLTICAERVALCELVQYKPTTISGIIIASGSDIPAAPCGACRQFISEFVDDCPVYLVAADGTQKQKYRFSELLPFAFKFKK